MRWVGHKNGLPGMLNLHPPSTQLVRTFVQQIIYNIPLKWHHHRCSKPKIWTLLFSLQFRDHYFILFTIEIRCSLGCVKFYSIAPPRLNLQVSCKSKLAFIYGEALQEISGLNYYIRSIQFCFKVFNLKLFGRKLQCNWSNWGNRKKSAISDFPRHFWASGYSKNYF